MKRVATGLLCVLAALAVLSAAGTAQADPGAAPSEAATASAAPAASSAAVPAHATGAVRRESVAARATFRPTKRTIHARVAETTGISITFATTGTISNLRAKVSGKAAKVLQLQPESVSRKAGISTISGTIQIPVEKPRSTYTGRVTLFNGKTRLGKPLTVKIRTHKPSATTIPRNAATPTPQRIGRLSDGQRAVKDELMVVVDNSVRDPSALIRSLAKRTGAVIQGAVPALRTYQLRFPVTDIRRLGAKRSALTSTAGVTAVAYDTVLEDQTIPNDPGYDSWTTDRSVGNNWALKYIDAPTAWDTTTGSRDVHLAVVDHPADVRQPELTPNLIAAKGSVLTSPNDHGTLVAGAACAAGNNASGIAGVMWTCGLLSMSGSTGKVLSLANVEEAMYLSVEWGATIVNLSLGGPRKEETDVVYSRAIQHAIDHGRDVLWVFAAGNDARDARSTSPAGLADVFPRNVMTVASVDRQGHLSSFSNRGTGVSVAAPGEDIYTTTRSDCDTQGNCRARFVSVDGTSLAAPIVAGVAGLVRSAHPSLNATQVKWCITNWARQPVPGQSFGIVNAADAVRCQEKPTKLEIVDTSLPLARTGQYYTTVLTGAGGTRPYAWAAEGLPAGLSLNPSTGEISGTPTAGDAAWLTVTLRDAAGVTATTHLRLEVQLPDLWAVGVGSGVHTTCVVTYVGRVYCAGENGDGQVGDGSVANAPTAVKVPDLADATAVASGLDHSCAVLSSGGVKCWGAYWYGQLGDGRTSVRGDAISTPVPVTGLTAAKAVASGDSHTCVLTAAGEVWCWGVNWTGQLGDPAFTEPNSPTPRKVPGLSGVTAISAGSATTCALNADGVTCWGAGGPPTLVDGFHGAKAMASYGSHVCAILSDETATCSGADWYGDEIVGLPGTIPDPGLGTVSAIAVGADHACAILKSSGQIRCWGRNEYGQLGDGTTDTNRDIVTATGLTNASSLTAGIAQTCARTGAGAVSCWGENSSGTLGAGDTVDKHSPAPMIGFS